MNATREEVKADALAGRLRLGELLVDSGVVDEATIEAALLQSKRTGCKLGEALVASGAITSDVLQRVLDRQRRLVAVAFSGMALSAALPAPVAAADTASVRIVASVLSRSSVESQDLPSEVTISAQDIARGYVDIADPVEIGTRSNRPGGVMLAFTANSPHIASIDIMQSAGTSGTGSGMIFIAQKESGLRKQTVRLKLRLKLAPEASPGRISFPVAVSLVAA